MNNYNDDQNGEEKIADAPLKIADASKFLGVTANTLRNWDRSGKLKAYRHPINGYRLYQFKELQLVKQQIDGLKDEE